MGEIWLSFFDRHCQPRVVCMQPRKKGVFLCRYFILDHEVFPQFSLTLRDLIGWYFLSLFKLLLKHWKLIERFHAGKTLHHKAIS